MMTQVARTLCPKLTTVCSSSRHFHVSPICQLFLTARNKIEPKTDQISYMANRKSCNSSNTFLSLHSSESRIGDLFIRKFMTGTCHSSLSQGGQRQEEVQDNSFIIRLRGVPWEATKADVVNFFKGIAIAGGENGVHLTTYRNSTRPTGEAFVVCASEDDYKKSFDYQKKTIGKRYIEIFSTRRVDFENIMRKQNITRNSIQCDTVVELKGLPWTVTEEEIVKFFDGLALNKENGVHLCLNKNGKPSSKAFVRFESTEDCEQALKRNMENIGERYIEIFRSTSARLQRSMSRNASGNDQETSSSKQIQASPSEQINRPSSSKQINRLPPSDQNDRKTDVPEDMTGLFRIHLRGMPYQCYETEILEFFSPLSPVHCKVIYNKWDKHSGDANVWFKTHDEAQEAMKRHREKMGSRYIELFYDNPPTPVNLHTTLA